MTVQFHFCDMAQAPAASCVSWSSPAKAPRQCRVSLRPDMAPAPNPGPTVAAGGIASVGIWRLLAVAAPHLAALAVMFQTETDFSSRLGFLLSWWMLNFFWIALLRRPALSGALSLTLVAGPTLVSPPKDD